MKAEQERVKTVLVDTVSLLCKNGLHFNSELKVQAVIGVSVDNDVFVVHINESFTPQGGTSSSASNNNNNNTMASQSADTTLALVPFNSSKYSQPLKRPLEATKRTPMSAAKRMRGGLCAVSPGNIARQRAKQHLQFASPQKPNSVQSPMSPPASFMAPSPANSPSMPRNSPASRGSPTSRGSAAPRGLPAARGSPAARGFPASHGSPMARGRGSPMVRGAARSSMGGQGHGIESGLEHIEGGPGRGSPMVRGAARSSMGGQGHGIESGLEHGEGGPGRGLPMVRGAARSSMGGQGHGIESGLGHGEGGAGINVSGVVRGGRGSRGGGVQGSTRGIGSKPARASSHDMLQSQNSIPSSNSDPTFGLERKYSAPAMSTNMYDMSTTNVQPNTSFSGYNMYSPSAAAAAHPSSSSSSTAAGFNNPQMAAAPGTFSIPGMNMSNSMTSSSGFSFDDIHPSDFDPSMQFSFAPNFVASDAGFSLPQQQQSSSQQQPDFIGKTIKTESDDDADIIFIGDDRPSVSSSDVGSAAGADMSSFADSSGVYGDMSSSATDVVQQITRRVTITTNIQGQNVKYEQVQVATLPGSAVATAVGMDPNASITTEPCDPLQYSNSSSADLSNQYQQQQQQQQQQQASHDDYYSYNPVDSKINWNDFNVDLDDPGSGTGPPTFEQSPHHSSSRGGKRPKVAAGNIPLSTPPVGTTPPNMAGTRPPSARGARAASAARGGPRFASPRSAAGPGSAVAGGGGQVGPRKPSSAATAAAGLPLSDIGVGGGRVEDGTAWSMVARFVCNVPGCGASFTLKNNLLRHQSQKHGRQKTASRDGVGGAGDYGPEDDDDYMYE